MPPKPLFESVRWQHTAIAVLMVTLFGGSMALAYLITARRQGPAVSPHSMVRVESLHLTLPNHWQRRHDLEQATPLEEDWVFVDATTPERRLHVVPLVAPPQAPPAVVLDELLAQLMSPHAYSTLKPIAVELPIPQGPQTVVEFTGVSETLRGGIAQHLAALLTADGRHQWLLYLTDAPRPGEDFRQRLNLNTLELRILQHAAQIGDAEPVAQ